jgi:hypothetical protein
MKVPIMPIPGATRTIVPAGSAVNVDFAQSASTANALLVQNTGNQVAWYAIGSTSQNATTADTVIIPGDSHIINRRPTDYNISAITVLGLTTSITSQLAFTS